jgi:uncharacterized protein DUF6894
LSGQGVGPQPPPVCRPLACGASFRTEEQGGTCRTIFFDLTDEKTIHDFKGKQLRDLKAAREHAITIARELIHTKSPLLSEPLLAWSVSVKNGKFEKVLSVPVSDVGDGRI